ncbi:MAG: hypothetical protein M0036_25235 [Desulfobacteraceae bacterium]|nr:hypothetical protein [Desulfobacteraceae bacterium]
MQTFDPPCLKILGLLYALPGEPIPDSNRDDAFYLLKHFGFINETKEECKITPIGTAYYLAQMYIRELEAMFKIHRKAQARSEPKRRFADLDICWFD